MYQNPSFRCEDFAQARRFMAEQPVARAWVDARAQRIYAGTNEIMKEVISRDL